jgi:hypothetical protein
MSVQDDKAAGHEEDRGEDERQRTEKPEPGEEQKKAAAEMMTAYEDKPTLVLPGSGRMVTGTAVGNWLDEDGNPKYEVPDDVSAAHKSKVEEARNDESKKEQIEKDKALNEELKKASAAESKGEKQKR